MTTHKAIRDAAEEGPYYTAMVAKPDLRALLADLDAKTAEVERLKSLLSIPVPYENTHQCKECMYAYTPSDTGCEDCPKCGFDGVSNKAALKGTP